MRRIKVVYSGLDSQKGGSACCVRKAADRLGGCVGGFCGPKTVYSHPLRAMPTCCEQPVHTQHTHHEGRSQGTSGSTWRTTTAGRSCALVFTFTLTFTFTGHTVNTVFKSVASVADALSRRCDQQAVQPAQPLQPPAQHSPRAKLLVVLLRKRRIHCSLFGSLLSADVSRCQHFVAAANAVEPAGEHESCSPSNLIAFSVRGSP